MRLSRGSVGALTAALLIAFAIWPATQAVRGLGQVVAQEKPKAKTPPVGTSGRGPDGNKPAGLSDAGRTPPPPIVPEPAPIDHPLSSDVLYRSKNEARIAAALRTQIDFQIKPQPFKDALEFIASHYQIPILIDHRAFEDANVDATQEVALSASGITLQDALHWLFSQMTSSIESEIRNGALWISTLDKIYEDQTIIVYDCRDLIPPETQERADESPSPAGGAGFYQVSPAAVQKPGAAAPISPPNASPNRTSLAVARRAAKLVYALKAAAPPPDFDSGDEGERILQFQGLLVARQNPFVHERTRRLLSDLRWMRTRGAFAPPGDFNPRGTRSAELTKTPNASSIPTPIAVRIGPEQVAVEDKTTHAKPGKTRARRKANTVGSAADRHIKTPLPPIIVENDRTHPPLSSDIPERSKNEALIATALNTPVDFRLQPQSFKAALDFVAARYHIPIVIDYRALADANFDLDTKVHVNISGITLHDLLHWLLAELNCPLRYEVCNGALFISTIDKLNEDLSIVVYDARDLLNPARVVSTSTREQSQGKDDQVKPEGGKSGTPGARAEQGHSQAADSSVALRVPQVQAIIAALYSRSDEAHIAEFDGLLVIRQNPLEHERIKRLLASIRLMKKNGAFSGLADQFVEPTGGAGAHPN